MDETSTSSSDGDSSTASNVKRSRSSSRGRKRTPSSSAEKSRGSIDSGSDNGRRSRSHSKGRKRSTSSLDNTRNINNSVSSDTERKDCQNHKSRPISRGRSSSKQCVVSDTELLGKNSSESENEIGRMPHSKSGGRIDLRAITGESKYRESCLTDVRRRGSPSHSATQSLRKASRGIKDRDVESCDESRRHSDPAEMIRVKATIETDRRCSLPAPEAEGLTCANYKVPRISSVVRKATIRKCRSELDGFLSDSKSSSSSSDAESTSSGRHSTTSELDHVTSEVIYECDEDSASCVSVAGSCASDNSLMSTSSSRSGTSNDIQNLPSLSDEAPSTPSTPLDDNADSPIQAFCSRSSSLNVSCSAYCSDSGVSCFDSISPLASQTRTAVLKTGEKTVARVRRLNTKTRRSNAGSLSHRRDDNRAIKDDNSTHLNSRELEMLIVGSCFGTGKCFDSHDTSDYESEPGCESLSDFDCQPKNKRSSLEESSVESTPSKTAASRLAGSGQSYSPVKASRDRYRTELAKMPKSDFRYKVVMQHSHKALSSIELTLKAGASVYLHHKELEILRTQAPIWVMAYSKSLGRIGFVPAVYVNIRLEDIM
nr:serine-rich adhesin for platelets-like [Lytechinus pictus]